MNIEQTVIRIIAQENHLEPGSVTLDSTSRNLVSTRWTASTSSLRLRQR